MGSGSWDTKSFVSYTTSTRGASTTLDSFGAIVTDMSNQDMFKARNLDEALNPNGVTRECRDSEEHPNTIPVILALDVTGSMGEAAVEVAKKINVIMTELYEKISDVEFMIMGIGDFYCDSCPLQVSQFESDIRIAEQLDKLYFEFGGGGNAYESYTAAWYFGSRHCKLDCWERGKKGIIITMGDECINPYIPKRGSYASIKSVIGDDVQSDIQTDDLYKETIQKFDVYHLQVNHGSNWNESAINKSWKEYLDDKHFRTVNLNSIANEIVNIIDESINQPENVNNTEGISW